MVELFLKHVLGVGSSHPGLYGNTSGYYGTVEQQGRLTLHLHMLLWIRNALTPQEIKDRIMANDSAFQKALVEYLEATHQGEFLDESMQQVVDKMDKKTANDPSRADPTMTLPDTAPVPCKKHSDTEKATQCSSCTTSRSWWSTFKDSVNEILFRSNRHTCHSGCKNRRYPSCKSRFPRDVHAQTTIDLENGLLQMKQGEAWLNTVTPLVSYVMRCNTDITSLLSGTAIKSSIAYITDYITKTPLRTSTMLEAIKTIFNR
ncbi:hypothetical protein FA95DRAFT_1499130, partial [Auriscalpium vulgare]